jgi:hypothetical protein
MINTCLDELLDARKVWTRLKLNGGKYDRMGQMMVAKCLETVFTRHECHFNIKVPTGRKNGISQKTKNAILATIAKHPGASLDTIRHAAPCHLPPRLERLQAAGLAIAV